MGHPVLLLKAVPGPARDGEAGGDIVGGAMVAVHRCGGGPGEVVVQGLAQGIVLGEADIGESEIEAGDGAAIHFVVFAIAAVDFDDAGFVAEGVGVHRRAAERFGPIRGEAFDMIGLEAVAEGVGDDFVGHDALVPGVGETADAAHAARSFEESLHADMMTIP